MLEKGLVSVIIPTFNCREWVGDAIESVLKQTYPNREIIVIDDGSTDGTGDFLKDKYKDSIRYSYRENKGLASARNRGLDEARGEYVQFLDADDLLDPEKLSLQVEALKGYDSLAFSYSDYMTCDILDMSREVPDRYRSPKLLHENPLVDLISRWETDFSIPVHCFLFSSVFFKEYGLRFDEALPNHEDWECWMRIVALRPAINYLDRRLAIYRIREDAMCYDIASMKKGYLMALRKQINLLGEDRQLLTLLIEKIGETELRYKDGGSDYEVPQNYTAQLFFDYGSGFSEEESIALPISTKERFIEFDLRGLRPIKALRFDPLNDYVVLSVKSIYIMDKNGKIPLTYQRCSLREKNGFLFSEDNDPQIVISIENVAEPTGVVFGIEYIYAGDRALSYIFQIKNKETSEKDAHLQEKDGEIERLKTVQNIVVDLLKGNSVNNEQNMMIAFAERELAVAERNRISANYERVVAEKNQLMSNYFRVISEKDNLSVNYEKVLADNSRILAEKNRLLADNILLKSEGKASVIETARLLAEKEDMTARATMLSKEIAALIASRSWRLTAPLRSAAASARLFRQQFGSWLSQYVRGIYRRLPFSYETKQRLKDLFFFLTGPFIRNTLTYRRWADSKSQSGLSNNTSETPVRNFSKKNREGRTTAVQQAEDYVEYRPAEAPLSPQVRVIAFYLPQFHPIPENNAWWGKGFTEWTNVARAVPQFEGHYQPHLPSDLGFYDLRMPEIQRQQVELAKSYGIGGFCFYFYWFGGKILLELPIRQYLENSALDLPFCLCWANENWSRRWDGKDADVLIAQKHSPEDDLAFIEHVSEYMRNPRYIRISGKPLLLVYRPHLLPDASETAKRWRDWCSKQGLGDIFLAYTQSFETVDPNKYGFDAAIEFPPNNSNPPIINDQVALYNPNFEGIVYDWRIFVERSRHYKKPGYRLFRGVCPTWDNEARLSGRGTVFLHSSPAGYQEWLENACADTLARFENRDERLVFVNAWNEWAEGAHLEPDRRYGYAWLQATRAALILHSDTAKYRQKIILVSHDAHPHGAQHLSLYLTRILTRSFNIEVHVVLLGDGVLAPEFERLATVHNLSGRNQRGAEAVDLARRLHALGFRSAIVNTTVSGLFLGTLSDAGLHCISLIHEMREVIDSYGLHPHAQVIAKRAEAVVFAAPQVAKSFNQTAQIEASHIKIRPQGLYKRNAFRRELEGARLKLRGELGLTADDRIVLGVGYADRRKGVDLFVEAGLQVVRQNPQAFFVWVGHWDEAIRPSVEKRLKASTMARHFRFVGRKSDTDLYYAGADVFALTSREDPFPSVVMESLEVTVPVVGFQGAGGFTTLIEKGCGLLVPFEDVAGFAAALSSLLDNPGKAKQLGERGRDIVHELFSIRHYLFDLLNWAGITLKRVSAIVPNYNYARHLEQRLASLFSQTYPLFEIIVIDDASTDNSVEVIERCLTKTEIDCRFIRNTKNSGSVFDQWRKGVEAARGDYIWICEADDFADPRFIECVVRAFDDPAVEMCYSQSNQVDENGQLLAGDYLEYTNDVCPQKWRTDYICSGSEELSAAMAVKNTIPNVSAVLFRRQSLHDSLVRCHDMVMKLKIAGDWLIYSDILRHGNIGFIAESLNSHRRHQNSVTISSANSMHMAEIIFMQKHVGQLVPLSHETVQKAQNYLQYVSKYLGLTLKDGENPAEHTEVSRWLEEYRFREIDRP